MAEESLVDETVLIKFAQKLAGNEKKFRDRALRKLRKFLQSRARSPKGVFTEADFLKIWKGLHYCMWMADKPLVQEELAKNLANLITCFKSPQQALLFIDVFLQTESREWFCIDRLRLDKFMMLIRRVLAGSLELLKRLGWKPKFIKAFTVILSKGVVSANSSTPDGLKFHVADAFMTELEKVGADELKPKQLELFLHPFVQLIVNTRSTTIMRHITKTVFFRIVDYGVEKVTKKLEKEEKGKNGGKEEQEEEEEEEEGEDEEESEEEIDEFTETFVPLEVNLERLAQKLLSAAASEGCHNENRKHIYKLVKTYQDLAAGILPAEEESENEENVDEIAEMEEAAIKRLKNFEKRLMEKTGKKRKQKNDSKVEIEEPPVKRQRQEKGEEKKSKNKFKSDTEKKKTKKEKLEKKKKVPKEEKVKKNKEEVNVFSGGFFDSDEENEESGANEVDEEEMEFVNGINEEDLDLDNEFDLDPDLSDPEVSFKVVEDETPKKLKKNEKMKKKDKKKKNKANNEEKSEKTSPSAQSMEEFIAESIAESTPVSRKKSKTKSGENEDSVAIDNSVTNGNSLLEDPETETPKLSKKKKRKSLGDLQDRITELKNLKKAKKLERRKSVGGSSSQTEGKVEKKTKERRKSLGDMEEGEVEIWVPNKKYTGKMKGWFEKQQKKSLEDKSSKDNKKGENVELVSFTGISQTPPAFVRKSIDKATPKSPKSKTKISRVDTPIPGGASEKKRVSFIMSKNESRALLANHVLSPLPAFNPDEKPASPIIKTTEDSPALPDLKKFKKLTKINTKKNTPKTFPIVIQKKKLGGQVTRVKASDFF